MLTSPSQLHLLMASVYIYRSMPVITLDIMLTLELLCMCLDESAMGSFWMRDSYGQHNWLEGLSSVICGYIRAPVTGVTPLERNPKMKIPTGDEKINPQSLQRNRRTRPIYIYHPSDLSQKLSATLSLSVLCASRLTCNYLRVRFQFCREMRFVFIYLLDSFFKSYNTHVTNNAESFLNGNQHGWPIIVNWAVKWSVFTHWSVFLYRKSPPSAGIKRTTGDGWIAGWPWLITTL